MQKVIKKTDYKSFFLRCHQNSQMAKDLFVSKPKYEDKDVSVLQIMELKDMILIVECINVEGRIKD